MANCQAFVCAAVCVFANQSNYIVLTMLGGLGTIKESSWQFLLKKNLSTLEQEIHACNYNGLCLLQCLSLFQIHGCS